jgi:hypothetical protein
VNLRYYTRKELDDAAALRPPGYLDEMMKAAVSKDAARVTFDTEHPAYVALEERYRGEPKIDVRRLRNVPLDPRTLEPAASDDAAEWGPKRWEELHRFCLSPQCTSAAALAEYVKAFAAKIPCGVCRAGLVTFARAHPPGQAADPFEWSWQLHEVVNAKLAKPAVTLDAARALWSTAAPETPPSSR